MSADDKTPGFAPDDPTDGRDLGAWETRYPAPEARKKIGREAIFLAILGFLWFLLTISLFVGGLADVLRIPSELDDSFIRFGAGTLGGLLGGTLMSIKWLYHTVARKLWNEDRWLWRLFTPFLSAGLSFGVLLLISSDLLSIFRGSTLEAPRTCMAIGFLVGLFSDSAIAKLKEVADTLFGTTKRNQ